MFFLELQETTSIFFNMNSKLQKSQNFDIKNVQLSKN